MAHIALRRCFPPNNHLAANPCENTAEFVISGLDPARITAYVYFASAMEMVMLIASAILLTAVILLTGLRTKRPEAKKIRVRIDDRPPHRRPHDRR
ncbi:MAG: hypothetical protein AAGB15_15485 [Pseudomonadota bacterium]